MGYQKKGVIGALEVYVNTGNFGYLVRWDLPTERSALRSKLYPFRLDLACMLLPRPHGPEP